MFELLTQDIVAGLDDIYIVVALVVWLLCNLTVFVWSNKPEDGSKYYKLYKLIYFLANIIPVDLLIRVLLSRRSNKRSGGSDAKKSD